MKTKRHRKQYCPNKCGYCVDAISGAGHDRLPVPGDFSICLNCYAVLRIEKGFKLKLSTLAEVESEGFELKGKLEKAIAAAKLVRVERALQF